MKYKSTVTSELLGISDKLGTIEASKLADLVAVSGDPVEDINSMLQVTLCNEECRDLLGTRKSISDDDTFNTVSCAFVWNYTFFLCK